METRSRRVLADPSARPPRARVVQRGRRGTTPRRTCGLSEAAARAPRDRAPLAPKVFIGRAREAGARSFTPPRLVPPALLTRVRVRTQRPVVDEGQVGADGDLGGGGAGGKALRNRVREPPPPHGRRARPLRRPPPHSRAHLERRHHELVGERGRRRYLGRRRGGAAARDKRGRLPRRRRVGGVHKGGPVHGWVGRMGGKQAKKRARARGARSEKEKQD